MASKSINVKTLSTSYTDQNKFKFDESFSESFKALVDIYSNALAKLNKISTGKTIKSEYGVCTRCYKLRYITPNDISTYISMLIKGIENNMFHDRLADIEMFTVASVKRFMEDNGCEPFETSSVLDNANRYVNPKDHTLHDLALMCENDTYEVGIYSRGEMVKRIELAAPDIKKVDSMHFAANIKKIVSSLPNVMEKAQVGCLSNNIYNATITKYIEEFLLFACTINTIAVLQLIGYAHPSVEYTVKPKEEHSEELVTECCLIKTNDFIIRNRIPFNCNMRDIVLQDVTPDFKDTHDAIHFIMKDARSPISALVRRYATGNIDHHDGELMASMFVGINRHYHVERDEWQMRNGSFVGDPVKANGFNDDHRWLDNIAFGNNYLDGNYRRDAMGNNNSRPALNTLDAVYKIFGGSDLKTNEDLANNVVRVSSLMRGIIHTYGENTIDNYDLTKDILTLLGEILTRNMLRLYYNNTRVYAYEDNMPDAATPGYLCMESFVMEADENNKTTTTQQSNFNDTKPGVSFSNQQGQQLKTATSVKISTLIQKFTQWVRTRMSKFSEDFNKNHEKEIEWVKNNMKLNQEIGEAIGKKTFNPKVTNFPKFNIPLGPLQKPKAFEIVQQNIDPTKTPEINADELIVKMSGIDDAHIEEYKKLNGEKSRNEGYINYVLYGSIKKPQMQTKDLEASEWKEMYEDILNSPEAISKITKAMSADLDKASDFLAKESQRLESATGEEAQKNAPLLTRCQELDKIIKQVSKSYKSLALNVMNSNFYSTNYTLYREIVAGYKQQTKSNPNTTTNTTNTTNTPSEPPSENANPTPQGELKTDEGVQ